MGKKIEALGFTPWVSTPALDYMGVGSRDLVPRKVLFLYDSREKLLRHADIHRFLAFPLEYLGYIPDYWDIKQGLPPFLLKGRYAGIVSWLFNANNARDVPLSNWLLEQVNQQIPIALTGVYTFKNNSLLTERLGLHFDGAAIVSPVSLKVLSESIGYELEPAGYSVDNTSIQSKTGEAWLEITDAKQKVVTPIFIDSWGGVALDPYLTQSLPPIGGDSEYDRWIVNPFDFLTAALKLTPLPIPEHTTENGSRILTIHIDGDGFYNKTEVIKGLYASELIRDQFFIPLELPHTVSIIEGEIGKTGLQPQLSPQMEKIAQSIFKLDNVEIASHSYSHPFDWFAAAEQEKQAAIKPKVVTDLQPKTEKSVFKAELGHYHLPIKGYQYSAEREIKGSVNYIDSVLAPKGKKTKVFLWTGDCMPNEDALRWTKKMQLSNMNGGDTVIRYGMESLTNVSASGIVRGDLFQPYAPIQNENVYTNDWTSTYYGYQRVIETFQLTDKPKRFKPMSIYYHFYSGARLASARALHRVYDWVMTQQPLPLWVSEYLPRVEAFRHAGFEKTAQGWRIYGAKELRTLRLPYDSKTPDLTISTGVVGFNQLEQGLYLSLSGEDTVSVEWSDQVNSLPFLKQSNARIDYWRKSHNTIQFRLKGHQPISLLLSGMQASCTLQRESGKKIMGKQQNKGTFLYQFKAKDTGDLKVSCG